MRPLSLLQSHHWINMAWAMLAFIVLIYSGGHFFTSAWRALYQFTASMDTLIALGTGAAWLYSVIVVLFPSWMRQASHVYFESVTVIINVSSG